MIQTFTQDDVVRYIYEETSTDENFQIETALVADDTLLGFYLSAIELKSLMNKIKLEPRPQSVEKVLEYSKNYKQNPFSAFV